MANVKLFDQTGKEVSTVELNDAIFGIEPNESVVLYYNHIVAWNGQNTMFLKKICGLCRECGGCLV